MTAIDLSRNAGRDALTDRNAEQFLVRHVSAAEFCELATSRMKLFRLDDPAAGLRGLVDLETDTRFVVNSVELEAYAGRENR